jgi:succinoglycan biosynthesis protein ExoA
MTAPVIGPRVTVVIPVRDEETRLPDCLEAVAAQDIPAEQIEVLVVDGGSSDGTVEVARRLLAGRGWARAEVLHCEAGDRSSNLNRGLAHAGAPVVVRVDARSRIPAHYVRRSLELLAARPDLSVVGGRQRAVAAGPGPIAAGVARALNNRWGMGLSKYRRARTSGEAETVYLGVYRAAPLREAGGWRTDFAVNEDFDLNRRIAAYGKVWFDVDLTVDYVPRSSLAGLLRQYWAFGQGKARYWRTSGDRPLGRQAGLLAAPVVALGAVAVLWFGFGVSPLWPLALGLAGAVALEVRGADGPDGGLLAHAAAVAALACVIGGWLAGVTAGAVRGMAGSFGPVRPEPAGGTP